MIARHYRNRSAWVVVGLCLAISAAGALAQELRTWTDSTGKHKMKGSFVSLEDGKVTLEKADGGTMEIDLKKLRDNQRLAVNKVAVRV